MCIRDRVYLEEETPDGKGSRNNLDNDPFELTHAQQMLDLLKNRDQIDHITHLNDTTDKGLHLAEISVQDRKQQDTIREMQLGGGQSQQPVAPEK